MGETTRIFCVKLFIILLNISTQVIVKCSKSRFSEDNTTLNIKNTLFIQDVPEKVIANIIAQYKSGRYNEDIYLNITQLIKKYGYPVEQHTVQTEDGYILTMFRIPRKGPVVFLMHGLMSCADDWITPGPQSSIGYLLAQDGYDVWIGNARGNKHSRRHIRLSPDYDKQKFWNFSFEEIGRYDIPAMINYILNKTNDSKLFYIGHSQGTTTFFVMCSLRPDHNEKIALMIALSPVAFMKHFFSPPLRLILPIAPKWFESLKEANIWEFIPSNNISNQLKSICKIGELGEIVCCNLMFSAAGFNYAQVNASNLHVLFAHTLAGAAVKQLEHYYQQIDTENFRRFDYGEQRNKIVYGSKYPPDYPLDKITAPVALFYSKNDYLVSIMDVLNLKKKLKNVVDSYLVPDEHFSHVDFVIALDVKKLIYSKIRRLFKAVTK